MMLIVTNMVNAQQSVVPPTSVKSAYTKSYSAQPVWSKQKEIYVAAFTDQEGKKNAYYSSEGNWIRTEREVPFSSLSQPVQNEINARFLGTDSRYELLSCYLMDSPDGIFHASLFKMSGSQITIFFSEDGKMLKREFKQ